MKRVLITGANSYIGTNVEKWLMREPDKYYVETLDMQNSKWREFNFSNFDVVIHVAGIAHVSTKKNMKDLYFKVNRDLTIETAEKAKADGVKQFLFMSSIIVYGDSSIRKRIIDNKTVPTPSNFYGQSKLFAEQGIKNLESDDFKIVILRPPMIYGKGSKGNFHRLVNLILKIPVFPEFNNERSMLYIDNLCEFIRLMIINKESGLFFPQNSEYVKTSDMVRLISEIYMKKIKFTRVFNWIIRLMFVINSVNKVFGNLVYVKSISEYKEDYSIRSFRESIVHTLE